jgi:hypothetical protein
MNREKIDTAEITAAVSSRCAPHLRDCGNF